MTLYDIEVAIIPQFVLSKHPCKRLQSVGKRSGGKGIATIVFIGVASSFRFQKQDVCDYLNIESVEYDNKSLRFKEYWREVMTFLQQPDKTQNFVSDIDYPYQVYLKTRLVLNALNIRFPLLVKLNELYVQTKKLTS